MAEVSTSRIWPRSDRSFARPGHPAGSARRGRRVRRSQRNCARSSAPAERGRAPSARESVMWLAMAEPSSARNSWKPSKAMRAAKAIKRNNASSPVNSCLENAKMPRAWQESSSRTRRLACASATTRFMCATGLAGSPTAFATGTEEREAMPVSALGGGRDDVVSMAGAAAAALQAVLADADRGGPQPRDGRGRDLTTTDSTASSAPPTGSPGLRPMSRRSASSPPMRERMQRERPAVGETEELLVRIGARRISGADAAAAFR